MDGGRECALKELKGYADSVGMQIITTPPDTSEINEKSERTAGVFGIWLTRRILLPDSPSPVAQPSFYSTCI
jgi:hypothetical protein